MPRALAGVPSSVVGCWALMSLPRFRLLAFPKDRRSWRVKLRVPEIARGFSGDEVVGQVGTRTGAWVWGAGGAGVYLTQLRR